MSGRVTKDRDVRLKGSNPAWLDRDREARGQGPAKVEAKIRRYRAGQTPHYAGDDADADDESEEEELGAFTKAPGRRAPARAVVVKPAVGAPGGGGGGGRVGDEPGERKVAAPV